MAQQRLTADVRSAILRAVLAHAFVKRKAALKKDWLTLGDAVYRDLYPADVQRKMADLPAGFFEQDDDVLVQFGSVMHRVRWVEQRNIARAHLRGAARVYPTDHPLEKRYRELDTAEDKLRGDEGQASAQTHGVLHSVRTYEKLIEVWPEIEPLALPFRQNEARGTSFALALPIPQLNKALGLPPQ